MVVYPGRQRFRFNEQIVAVPLSALADEGVFAEHVGGKGYIQQA